MVVRRAPDVRSSEITDERLYLNRREFIRTAGVVLAATGGAMLAAERPAAA
jgi:hypothetical protein